MNRCTRLSFLLLPVLLSPLTAQEGWHIINRKPQTHDLHDLIVLTQDRAVAVGERGVIRVMEDGGSRTAYPESGTENTLRSVAFFDSLRGIAVGDGGAIVRTVDGGTTWNSVPSVSGDVLLSVATDGLMRAVAVGVNGTIVLSEDGGATWSARSSEAADTLFGVAGSEGGTFIAVGNGIRLRSRDRGASWQKLSGDVGADWKVVAVAGGVWRSAGAKGALYESRDDGETWKRLNAADTTFRYLDLSFFGEMEGARSGYAGDTWDSPFRVELTRDGGETWIAPPGLDVTLGDAVAVVGSGISFLNGTLGMSVGPDGSTKRYVRSGVESAFTSTVLSGYTSYTWTDVDCADAMNCVAVGYRKEFGRDGVHPLVERTTDGGETWRELAHTLQSGFADPPQTPVFRSVHCFDAVRAIVAGDSGIVLRTVEGEDRLERIPLHLALNRPLFFDRLSFPDGLHGSMVSGGDLLLSDDAGETWRGDSLSPYNLRIPHRSAPDRIFVSSPYYFHRSTDDGHSWSMEDYRSLLPEDIIFSEIVFTDDRTGWIAASRKAANAGHRMNGVLLRTTDAGLTWVTAVDRELPGAEFGLRALDFADAQYGIVMGTRENAYHTTDFGETWSPVPLPVERLAGGASLGFGAVAVSYPVPGRAVAVSTQGEMLQYNSEVSGVDPDDEIHSDPLPFLAIVPNPAKGIVRLTALRPIGEGRDEIVLEVCDLIGRKISRQTFAGRTAAVTEDRVTLQLNAENLAPGIYVVSASGSGRTESRLLYIVR